MKPENSESTDIQTLEWDDLVALKRKLSGELKDLTDKIIDIDKNQFHSIMNSIRDQKGTLDLSTERLKQSRPDIDKRNAELLAVSEKISQSKNFLGMMESRLPSEKEDDLHAIVQSNQALIDGKNYKSEREKNEILSKIKDASMKLEAIKATRTVKEQLAKLTQETAGISDSIKKLEEEREFLRAKIAEINNEIDRLYDSKRKLSSDREYLLTKYDGTVKQFDFINTRLDAMAKMRKKQREEYGYGLPTDALFKVKEMARKKLESGSKLSFEELKLLYGEKD